MAQLSPSLFIQILFSPNFFFTPNSIGLKFSQINILGPKNFLIPRLFFKGPKSILIHCFLTETYLYQKKSNPKFWSQFFFWSKIFLIQKMFLNSNYFDPKYIWVKHLFNPNFFSKDKIVLWTSLLNSRLTVSAWLSPNLFINIQDFGDQFINRENTNERWIKVSNKAISLELCPVDPIYQASIIIKISDSNSYCYPIWCSIEQIFYISVL